MQKHSRTLNGKKAPEVVRRRRRVYSSYKIALRTTPDVKDKFNKAYVRAGHTNDIESVREVGGVWWIKVKGGWFRATHNDGKPRVGLTLYNETDPIDLAVLAIWAVDNGRN